MGNCTPGKTRASSLPDNAVYQSYETNSNHVMYIGIKEVNREKPSYSKLVTSKSIPEDQPTSDNAEGMHTSRRTIKKPRSTEVHRVYEWE